MKYVYPALFVVEDDGIIVTFPDLDDTFTDGATMQEAFENAEDVLNLMLWNREEEKEEIPPPITAGANHCTAGCDPCNDKSRHTYLSQDSRHKDHSSQHHDPELARYTRTRAQYQLLAVDAKCHPQGVRHWRVTPQHKRRLSF